MDRSPTRRTRLPQIVVALVAVAVLAVGLVLATGGPPPTAATDPGAAAAEGGAAGGGSADRRRCTKAVDQPSGTSARYTVTSAGLDRRYVMHLPKGYEKRSDWPMIFAFHGRGSTSVELEGFSSLSNLPAVVVYPDGEVGTGLDGHRRAWQGAPYAAAGVDDVAFTEELLDDLQSRLCVDTDRTYATGKSNGGGFAALLGCRLPDRFAAIAPVAGAYYPGTREDCVDSSIPVLAIHGTADESIEYPGEPNLGLPPIPEWAADRAADAGCTEGPRTRTKGKDVTTSSWSGCDDGSAVSLVTVAEGGHVWPGAEVYSGAGYVTRTIEGHEVVWDFLRRHEL